MSNARSTTRVLRIALWCALLGFIGALASQCVETRGSAAYQCGFEAPEGAAQSEIALVSSRVSAWPIGRSCTWVMEAGGTTTVHSEWTATTVAVIATGTCLLVAGAFAYLACRRRAPRLWWWVALGLIAPTATWLILTTTASIFVYTLP
ncbi:hypothetical protein [Microbacterium sp. cx-59]|uniref:hypothetical protein n=1 Tax=Microbacterium sp. cx-59 TaxID=2891207 RepID=UPI001E5104DC|nr:hypothetical protein [Microbacterium sp. cx-59]MCC4908274.1 hypothetical protein [Microbacterium sp. cx-59]